MFKVFDKGLLNANMPNNVGDVTGVFYPVKYRAPLLTLTHAGFVFNAIKNTLGADLQNAFYDKPGNKMLRLECVFNWPEESSTALF